jgi:hypothetical protein
MSGLPPIQKFQEVKTLKAKNPDPTKTQHEPEAPNKTKK